MVGLHRYCDLSHSTPRISVREGDQLTRGLGGMLQVFVQEMESVIKVFSLSKLLSTVTCTVQNDKLHIEPGSLVEFGDSLALVEENSRVVCPMKDQQRRVVFRNVRRRTGQAFHLWCNQTLFSPQ